MRSHCSLVRSTSEVDSHLLPVVEPPRKIGLTSEVYLVHSEIGSRLAAASSLLNEG